MDFTLRSYLSNPYGKGSTIVPNLQGIKEGYMASHERYTRVTCYPPYRRNSAVGGRYI